MNTQRHALEPIKEVVEMPDADAYRIMRSLRLSQWVVGTELRQAYPELFVEGGRLFARSLALVEAMRTVSETMPDRSRP